MHRKTDKCCILAFLLDVKAPLFDRQTQQIAFLVCHCTFNTPAAAKFCLHRSSPARKSMCFEVLLRCFHTQTIVTSLNNAHAPDIEAFAAHIVKMERKSSVQLMQVQESLNGPCLQEHKGSAGR
jgi:hypothetical protein